MSFFKNIFSKKEAAITTYSDFWDWFLQHEKDFFKIVKNRENIEQDFFNKMAPKLNEIQSGFYFLTGMYNDDTAELIFTPEGVIKNIFFVEELVKAAPKIEGWKFTALKPATDMTGFGIKMEEFEFNKENIKFYSNNHKEYSDKIDLTIVYDDFVEEQRRLITNGIYIFLDNFLGELDSLTIIDHLSIVGREGVNEELIPIEKLKDYLIWREKEFVEKYEAMRHNTENDSYACLETNTENGPLLAVINTDLVNWDAKMSHPWITIVTVFFDGKSNNGMPDEKMYKFLDNFEDELTSELKDFEGYLNIGRETGNNKREIYFACKDFRKPSKILSEIETKYSKELKVTSEIYKDKYWASFKHFEQN
ncbi:MAG: DUF695 domain-containing protein [Flavobacterium sp.]